MRERTSVNSVGGKLLLSHSATLWAVLSEDVIICCHSFLKSSLTPQQFKSISSTLQKSISRFIFKNQIFFWKPRFIFSLCLEGFAQRNVLHCNIALGDSKALASLLDVLEPCSLFSQRWYCFIPQSLGLIWKPAFISLFWDSFLIRSTLDSQWVLMEIIYTKNQKELNEKAYQEGI